MGKQKAKVLSSREVFKGRVFSVRHDRVREPGGIVAERDIVVHPGSVVVLPVFPDGKILLIRQYRHAANDFLWELVAGRVDKGESPAAAAHRELAEETGYSARRLHQTSGDLPFPWLRQRTDVDLRRHRTHCFYAARPEADERIAAKTFSLAAAERMIRSGALRDAKSIAAILYYARFVR